MYSLGRTSEMSPMGEGPMGKRGTDASDSSISVPACWAARGWAAVTRTAKTATALRRVDRIVRLRKEG
jgi:hypothetical protein